MENIKQMMFDASTNPVIRGLGFMTFAGMLIGNLYVVKKVIQEVAHKSR